MSYADVMAKSVHMEEEEGGDEGAEEGGEGGGDQAVRLPCLFVKVISYVQCM